MAGTNFEYWRRFAIVCATAFVLTGCLQQQGTSPEAEKPWTAYFEDGKIFDFQHRNPEAREQYKLALEKLPGAPFEQDGRAETLARMARLDVVDGNLESAKKLADEAVQIAIDPKAVKGPNHGEVLVALDDVAEAYSEYSYKSKKNQIQCLEMAVKILDQPFQKRHNKVYWRSITELAVAYIIAGRLDEARPLEAKIMKETKKKFSVARDFAAAYRLAGDRAKEAEYLALAETLNKKKYNKIAIANSYTMQLAKLYRENDRFDEAIQTIDEHIEKMKPRTVNADFYAKLATIYEAKKDIKNADKNYKIAVEMDRQTESKKSLRHRLEEYAHYLRRTGRSKQSDEIQQEADGMRDVNAF